MAPIAVTRQSCVIQRERTCPCDFMHPAMAIEPAILRADISMHSLNTHFLLYSAYNAEKSVKIMSLSGLTRPGLFIRVLTELACGLRDSFSCPCF